MRDSKSLKFQPAFRWTVLKGYHLKQEPEINHKKDSISTKLESIRQRIIDWVSNATIYDLTQAAPLVENVITRQLRFLGHVHRMPDDEPCKYSTT